MYFYILYLAIYTYTHTRTHTHIYIYTHIHICIYKPPMWLSNKEFACQCKRDTGDAGLTPVWEDPLEKEVPTHFSILAWIIPWTEEPGGLQSVGSRRVRIRLKQLSMHAYACLLYDPTLTSECDYWKDHSFDYLDLYWQSNVSAF